MLVGTRETSVETMMPGGNGWMGWQPMLVPGGTMNLLTGGLGSGMPMPLNPGLATASMAAAAGVPPGQLRNRMAADLPPLTGTAEDNKSDEDKHRAVVVKALKEIAEKEKKKEKPKEEEKKIEKPKPSDEPEDADSKPRCFLHKRPNPKCKKCQAALSHSSKKEVREPEAPRNELPDADEVMRRQRDDRNDKKVFQCSPMLKEQIIMSAYFKSLLEITGIEGLINEIIQYADTLDVYNPGSKTSPSCFMCHVFRLSTLSHIENELSLLIDNRDYAVVRCVGFLYIRFVTPPAQLWETLEEYLLDDMELIYAQDGAEVSTTIGEYVESLLIQDKYFDSPVPRLPVKVRQTIEEKVAPMLQYRKRMQANRRVIRNDNVEDMSVEVSIDGRWHKGVAKELAGNVPSRIKIRVSLEDGRELKAHLGKVIISEAGDDSDDGGYSRRRRRSRSRSPIRKRGRDVSPDWSRSKGKSDREMLQELRERAKESAVTSHGKTYARRPLAFDASMASTALPDPSRNEPDAYMRRGGGGRRISREEEEELQEAARRKQAEDDERQRRLHSVFQKYCATPSASSGSAYAAKPRGDEVDTPDVLRLG